MARRSLESYLWAQILPRFMERLREIHDELRIQESLLERAWHELARECAGDEELFARRWRETAQGWRADHLNELIAQHNEYYPIEANLPVDPRTGEYVTFAGRPYRRRPLDAAWVLERFPPRLPDGLRVIE